ncbi:MAG: hypothetical protein JWO26_3571, partial [Rhodospirillales bacterium]|nr:hypothetical protein [Rhodospirillales bacterium]
MTPCYATSPAGHGPSLIWTPRARPGSCAPLGFYLPAGLAGRLFGLPAAQGMLWMWCGLGLALVLALLATLARKLVPTRPRGAFAVLALIFVLFHGADILPNLVLDLNAGATMLAGWGRGG